MAKGKDILTTGQVAQICGVSYGTVQKWFDLGLLKGYILPGGKDRRIQKAELICFMKNHKMSVPKGFEGKTLRTKARR